jgi:hypothetical protein
LSSFQGWQRTVCLSITFWRVCSSMIVAEFREDVRIIIPTISERVEDSDFDVRMVATEGVWKLAVQGMC